jgi:hypothetical protein
MHPQTIISGFRSATDVARKTLTDFSNIFSLFFISFIILLSIFKRYDEFFL